MDTLIDRVPVGTFWGLVAGFALGAFVTWKFARLWERFREAIWQSRNSFHKAVEFYRFARQHLTLLVGAGALLTVSAAAVGALAIMRATG